MASLRTRTFSVVVIAGLLAMPAGPLLAAQSHDVCDAMHHGCASIDALASCCCNGSGTNPSQVPSVRADVAGAPHVLPAIAAAFVMPANAVVLVREGPPDLGPPPDFRILFSDLRI